MRQQGTYGWPTKLEGGMYYTMMRFDIDGNFLFIGFAYHTFAFNYILPPEFWEDSNGNINDNSRKQEEAETS